MSTMKDEKTRVAEAIWLDFFNNYLYSHGVISEKHYRQMQSRIWAAKAQQ